MSANLSTILDAISTGPTADLRRLAREAQGRLAETPALGASLAVLLAEALAVWMASSTPIRAPEPLVIEDLGVLEPTKALVAQTRLVVELLRVVLAPGPKEYPHLLGRLGVAVRFLVDELPLLLEEVGDHAGRAELVTLLSTLPEARS